MSLEPHSKSQYEGACTSTGPRFQKNCLRRVTGNSAMLHPAKTFTPIELLSSLSQAQLGATAIIGTMGQYLLSAQLLVTSERKISSVRLLFVSFIRSLREFMNEVQYKGSRMFSKLKKHVVLCPNQLHLCRRCKPKAE